MRRILLLFGVLQACRCDDDLRTIADAPAPVADDDPPATPVGSIAGCVCDDEAGAWVVGANVYVVEDTGAVAATGTDDDGCFTLAGVTAGPHVLKIDLAPFHREHDVVVIADDVVTIETPATCVPPVVEPGETGRVAGRVCAPDGETWLAGADVFVLEGTTTVASTTTDADGAYLLAGVPVGAQTLHIQKGSFTATRAVTIVAGQTTTLPDDTCALDTTPNIALVTGLNDDVGAILESIGVDAATITTYTGSYSTDWGPALLEDYATLSQFDIVFINCGANGIDDYPLLLLFPTVVNSTTAIDNLRQFVAEGGSVYASDEAYDLIERAWPDAIDFWGDDLQIDAAQIGVQEGDPVVVDIVDPGLQTGMGVTQFDIHFNYTLWAIIADVAPTTTVYTRGDAPTSEGVQTDAPLTVGFSSGLGRVLYTSFHQESGTNSATQRLLELLMFEL